MTRLIVSAALACAMGLASLPAHSQSMRGPMGMMGGGCPMMGMMGRGMMGRGWSDDQGGRHMMGRHPRMGAMVDGRLAYLKSELEITDAQAAAWDAYATAVEGRVETMQGMHEGMMETMTAGTAIERMDVRIAGMEAMLESLKAMKPATEGLYAALSDDQKKLADELIGNDCGAF